MKTVAALFIDPKGIYPTLPDVDCWDKARDARTYAYADPVVAHPPCQLWGRFAHVNFARWGGEHNRPGNDGGCFASALANVRRCGGVLEHPAFSEAWAAHGLTRPSAQGWTLTTGFHGPIAGTAFDQRIPDPTTGLMGEWVCEVWQSAYGHPARKRTWLLYCGDTEPTAMCWDRPEGTHQIGFHDQRGKAANKPTVSGRKASATPPLFAAALIELARHSALQRKTA